MNLRRSAVLPAAVLLMALVATWPSVQSLIDYWRQIQDYEHGLLLAPLAFGWAGWQLWRGAAVPGTPSRAGLFVLVLLLVGWALAQRSGFDIVHQLLWPALLAVSLWSAGGLGLMRGLAAPLALLYFAIPVWDYTLPVLQRLSILFSEHLLALLGVPATVTEYRVTIPEGTFAIIEGCSGKRFLVVSLAVAWIASFLQDISGLKRVAFLAAAALLSMITNWIRIVIVIYAGHVTNMQHHWVAVEHFTLGNVMFAILLVAILLLSRRLGRAAAFAPAQAEPPHVAATWTSTLPMVAALLAASWVVRSPAAEAMNTLGPWPLSTARWSGPLPPTSGWMPAFAAAHMERRGSYASPEGAVDVYVNFFRIQKPGAELIQYGNNLSAPEGWNRPWLARNETIPAASDLSAFQMEGPDGRRWVVAYTYTVGSRLLRSSITAKLAYGWQSLYSGTPSGVLAMAAPCDAGFCDNARALVADFWDHMQPTLRAMLQEPEPSFP